jgi:hypothetical protein
MAKNMDLLILDNALKLKQRIQAVLVSPTDADPARLLCIVLHNSTNPRPVTIGIVLHDCGQRDVKLGKS